MTYPENATTPVDGDRSPQLGKLAEALAKAQGAIRNATKDRENPFFKSKYATLAAVWDVIRAPLSSNGLAVVQAISTTDRGVAIITTLLHASGEFMRTRMEVPAKEMSAQGLGSASSYGRRYSLQAMVGVAVDEEDDDGNEATKPQQRRQSAPQPQRQQAARPPDARLEAMQREVVDAPNGDRRVPRESPTPAPKPPTVVDVHDGETEEQAKARTAAATPSGFFARALHLAKSKGGWEEHNVRNWLKVKRGRNAASEVTAEDVVALGLALEPPAAEGAKQ